MSYISNIVRFIQVNDRFDLPCHCDCTPIEKMEPQPIRLLDKNVHLNHFNAAVLLSNKFWTVLISRDWRCSDPLLLQSKYHRDIHAPRQMSQNGTHHPLKLVRHILQAVKTRFEVVCVSFTSPKMLELHCRIVSSLNFI